MSLSCLPTSGGSGFHAGGSLQSGVQSTKPCTALTFCLHCTKALVLPSHQLACSLPQLTCPVSTPPTGSTAASAPLPPVISLTRFARSSFSLLITSSALRESTDTNQGVSMDPHSREL